MSDAFVMDESGKALEILRPSKESDMVDLHAYLARELRRQIVEGTVEVDKKGGVVKVPPTPALLNVVRQFLRDNGVQADAKKNADVGDLLHSLPEFESDSIRPSKE